MSECAGSAIVDLRAIRQPPPALPAPCPVAWNKDVATLLDLDADAIRQAGHADALSGNGLPDVCQPVAYRYGGHQFGVRAGQLGDGRAITIGDIRNARGQAYEIQLKGAGKTPLSRFADGRAVLRSVVREYLGAEALAALGIPTMRALAIGGSDTPVYRETGAHAAVMTRIASSLVRFGSFEILFENRQFDALAPLANHVIGEHFADVAACSTTHTCSACVPSSAWRTLATGVANPSMACLSGWPAMAPIAREPFVCSAVRAGPEARDAPFMDEFVDRDATRAWLARWRERLSSTAADDTARAGCMRLLCNYLAQNAIERADEVDYSEIERLHEIPRHPVDEQPEHEAYATLPPDWARGPVLSCSS